MFVFVFVLVAACDASPKPPPTSLAGPTACEGMTCDSGQICHAEVAQDAGITAFCVVPPDGCAVTDCYGYGSNCTNCTCPDCLAKLCGYYPIVPNVAVDGTRSRGGLRSGDQGRSLATT